MNPELSEAVQLYLGFGSASWPQTDRDAVANRFGERAPQLSATVDAVLSEAAQFQPDWSENDLSAATGLAAEYMRERHPELTDEAIKAIAWAWSYWNR